jgi:hypothetical protein
VSPLLIPHFYLEAFENQQLSCTKISGAFLKPMMFHCQSSWASHNTHIQTHYLFGFTRHIEYSHNHINTLSPNTVFPTSQMSILLQPKTSKFTDSPRHNSKHTDSQTLEERYYNTLCTDSFIYLFVIL